jgi:hypothetical protein
MLQTDSEMLRNGEDSKKINDRSGAPDLKNAKSMAAGFFSPMCCV